MRAHETSIAELAFDFAPIGLLVTRERVIERSNRTFTEMFGFRQEELEGNTTEMLYPSHAEYVDTGVRGVRGMRSDGIYRDERIMRHRDGQLFWCAVTGRPLDPNAPYACAIWTFEDLRTQRPIRLSLTGREREISALILEGLSSKQIARELSLSPRTVETYRLRLMRKLEVKSVGELIARLLGLAAGP